MKWLKVGIPLLMVCGVVLLSAGCKSGGSAATKPQYATVQKGSISIEVTGTGNLAMETKKELAFEVDGTVSDVLVSVSDSVKKDQQLATLDTTAWDNQIKTLQKAVTTATRNLTTAQRGVANAQDNVLTAQENVVKAQRAIPAKQLAVDSAKLDVQTAQNSLNNISDVKKAQDAVTATQNDLDTANNNLQQANISGNGALATNLINLIPTLKAYLVQTQKDLSSLLAGTSLNASSDMVLAISKAQLAITQAQNNVVAAQNALDDANQAVTDAQNAIADAETAVQDARTSQGDAEQNVSDAQSALDDTKNLSPVITAPIDGIVTLVNVKGGDVVKAGTVAIEIADPTQFAANILVSEKDIFSVKVGGTATITFDALTGMTFPAKVTSVAPTATTQQGVVNYKVAVELTSLRPTIAGFSRTAGSITAGSATAGFTPPSGFTPPTDFTPGSGFGAPPSGAAGAGVQNAGGNGSGNAANTAPLQIAVSLKDGLSSTVNIMIQEEKDILLVPSRAISRSGRNSIVQVLKGTTTESVTIQTGISDSTNTEVTSGLNEGDQVLLPTSSTSSSSSINGVPAIPGIGGGGAFRIGG
jgi:multidrug efflux pump subunit AcrA (membrane-fusion protein)